MKFFLLLLSCLLFISGSDVFGSQVDTDKVEVSDSQKDSNDIPPPPLITLELRRSHSNLLKHKPNEVVKTSREWYLSRAYEKHCKVKDSHVILIIDPDGWRTSDIKWAIDKITLDSFLLLAHQCSIYVCEGDNSLKIDPI